MLRVWEEYYFSEVIKKNTEHFSPPCVASTRGLIVISRESQSNFSYESLTGKKPNKHHVELMLCKIIGSDAGLKLPEASHHTDFNPFRETRSC